jgi:hypothetical protein
MHKQTHMSINQTHKHKYFKGKGSLDPVLVVVPVYMCVWVDKKPGANSWIMRKHKT